MSTSAGKRISRSEEYGLMASMTSHLSSAFCCFEREAIFVRRFSDISRRNVQKFSSEMDARIEKRNRRSDVAVTPASERTARNLPGSAKRNASGESGAGGGESAYRPTIC